MAHIYVTDRTVDEEGRITAFTIDRQLWLRGAECHEHSEDDEGSQG